MHFVHIVAVLFCVLKNSKVCIIDVEQQMVSYILHIHNLKGNHTSVDRISSQRGTKKQVGDEQIEKRNKGLNRSRKIERIKIVTQINSTLQATSSSFYSNTSLTSRFLVISVPGSHYKPSVCNFRKRILNLACGHITDCNSKATVHSHPA